MTLSKNSEIVFRTSENVKIYQKPEIEKFLRKPFFPSIYAKVKRKRKDSLYKNMQYLSSFKC